MPLLPETRRRAAELLLAARRELRPLPALPEDCRPDGPAQGYAIQAAVLEARGGAPAGFKIGATSETARTLLATESPFYGCLFQDGIHASPADLPAGRFNFRLIEPEFAFRLGADLPARDAADDRDAAYDRDAVGAAVASLHPAFEVVTSAFGAAWTGVGLAALIADNGVHGALVLGAGVSDWRGLDLAAHPVTLLHNGVEAGRGVGANALGHPLNALAWLANSRMPGGRGLKAGDVVTTGLVTPFVYANAGDEVRADFGALGEVELRFSG